MQGSLDNPPIVLLARRWNARQLQYFGALALVIAVDAPQMFVAKGGSRLFIYGFMSFAVTVLALRIWMIVVPPRLTIDQVGVTLRSGWRTRKWTWDAVRDFRPVQYSRIERVGFDFTTTKKNTATRQLNSSIAGAQAVLPGNYDMAPVEMAGLLNRARERWAGRLTVQPEPAPRRTVLAALLTVYYVLLIGRISRRTFWISIAVLIALQAVMALAFKANELAVIWGLLGYVMLSRGRIRDIGWASWIGIAIPIVTATVGFLLSTVADALFNFGGDQHAFALVELTVLAAMVPLGAINGDPKTNTYGPPPGGEKQSIDSVFS